MLRRLEQVMMIVPVDPHINEAQHIAQENREKWLQCRKPSALGGLHFQHHDSYDDGEHPITECFHAPLGHTSSWVICSARRSPSHVTPPNAVEFPEAVA